MIITKTPFRVSFFGGGTDYSQWFKENGGLIISSAINKYCYISIRLPQCHNSIALLGSNTYVQGGLKAVSCDATQKNLGLNIFSSARFKYDQKVAFVA
jgi:galactokinase/mevalonate kinase-like predicted kinase